MEIAIDCDYLVKTLADLVSIDSINPSLVPGSAGEAKIAAYTANTMSAFGLDVTIHEPQPGRPSVAGILPGRDPSRGRSLMLNAHYDTVGVTGMDDPFSPLIREGQLYGRGAYDMKGALAACITAAKALVEAGVSLSGDLLVTAVADEEYASLGTADIIGRYQVDGAIVTEPTGLEICLAHKGFTWLEVETQGRAAHGSRFDLGIDANMRMGRFLARLDLLEQDLRSRRGHPLLGPPSLHAAMIQGGTEYSAYAASCRLQIERRTIPGESQFQVMEEIQDLIRILVLDDPSFNATVTPIFTRQAFEIEPEAAIVQATQEAATTVLGTTPSFTGQNPWMDAALLADAGIETVIIGPEGAGAHSKEEWVDIDSLEKLAQILALAAVNYCQP